MKGTLGEQEVDSRALYFKDDSVAWNAELELLSAMNRSHHSDSSAYCYVKHSLCRLCFLRNSAHHPTFACFTLVRSALQRLRRTAHLCISLAFYVGQQNQKWGFLAAALRGQAFWMTSLGKRSLATLCVQASLFKRLDCSNSGR